MAPSLVLPNEWHPLLLHHPLRSHGEAPEVLHAIVEYRAPFDRYQDRFLH